MFQLGDRGHLAEHNRIKATTTSISPTQFGGVGDGATDDSNAIRSALAACISTSLPLYLPPGRWVFSGPPLAPAANFSMFGAGINATTVALAPGVRLVERSALDNVHIRDLTVSGGSGLLHCNGNGVNVSGNKVFERLVLDGYTGCAIGHEHTDSPNWKIRDCMFRGADFANTIGVALPGLTDSVTIQDCEFLRNRVGVKLGHGGNNAHISNCGFLRWSKDRQTGPAVDVWVVPKPDPINAGPGFTFTSSKLGNENLVAGDLRIVYADEASGASFATRLPDLSTPSTGYVDGHVLHAFAYIGGDDGLGPIAFSTTPNVTDHQIALVSRAGSAATADLAFLQ